jgi:hypothetical protein
VTHPNILVPVDIQGNRFPLQQVEQLFSKAADKRFTGFFLSDFVETGKPDEKAERLQWQAEIDHQARAAKVDFQFMMPVPEDYGVVHQSRFADVALMGPVAENVLRWPHENMVAFFSRLACPVMLVHQTEKPFQEILLYPDSDFSSLAALKTFQSLFGPQAADKRLTVLASAPDDEQAIFFEKCLVNYLQSEFRSVGILPTNEKQREEQLLTFASRMENPLIITGAAGKALLKNEPSAGRIFENKISMLYAG